MVAIRPQDLPAAPFVTDAAALIVDTGAAVQKATPSQIVDAGRPIASQAEAEAGANNSKAMTPLRAKQAMDVASAAFADVTGAALVGTADGQTLAQRLAAFAANAGATLIGTADGQTIAQRLAAFAASAGASLIGFIQAGIGAVARTMQAKARETVSVTDFGAVGDAVTDDTGAIQKAIDHCVANRIGTLHFPAASVGNYYKVTAPLVINGPIRLLGPNPHATQIIAIGMAAGQFIFDFDCLAADNIENVEISGLTIRSVDGVPNGIRFKNVSNVEMHNVRLYGLYDGITYEGTRCYTHLCVSVVGYQIGRNTLRWVGGFSGGGHFTYNHCTFAGTIGVNQITGAYIDGLAFFACNWEPNTVNGMFIGGTVVGLSVVACRTERGLGIDFVFRPFGALEFIGGLHIAGTIFLASDSSATDRIVIGGDSGKVRGFQISGNVVTHGLSQFGGKLINFNGEGGSGTVTGNYIRGVTGDGAGVINAPRAGVMVFGNENMTGALPDYFGTTGWTTVS